MLTIHPLILMIICILAGLGAVILLVFIALAIALIFPKSKKHSSFNKEILEKYKFVDAEYR